MADDDEDDRKLTRDAFEESRLANDLRFVENGEELLDYLSHRGRFQDEADAPRPGVILLDLNMPRKDGLTVLNEIKADPNLREIPLIVLSKSKAWDDISSSYNLGAYSYIEKPVTFEALIDVLHTIGDFGIRIMEESL